MQRRPCWVEIATGALKENYRALQQVAGAVELLAIVKADAYGHGLELCAPAAVEAGVRWLGVTSVEEGVAARRSLGFAGCDPAEPDSAGHDSEVDILVISGPFEGQGAAAIASRLTLVVWEEAQITLLEAAAGELKCGPGDVPVHLEFDTGMSRQGVAPDSLAAVLTRLAEAESPLRLDGLMTHLYAADESYGVATNQQMGMLDEMVALVFAMGLRPRWLHVGNSASVISGEALSGQQAICKRWGMRAISRPGLALYGLVPEFAPEEPIGLAALKSKLRPVLAWKTRVVSLRSIAAGQAVGYNGTFVATEPMRLALLAVGYADGLSRALSNLGEVLVGGCRAPIVGRISMDQTVVDVTGIDGVMAGDEVMLLGSQGAECITALDHAWWAGTIPWEVFTSIAGRVERRSV